MPCLLYNLKVCRVAKLCVYLTARPKCYYETLKLQKNCSEKDIREAFVKLSKQYHPDLSNDNADAAKFAKIKEAYNILSKPRRRAEYDATNIIYSRNKEKQYYHQSYAHTFASGRTNHSRRKDNSSHYYGVAGLRKQSNYVIVAACLVITAAGAFLQIWFISATADRHRNQNTLKSQENARILAAVQARARESTTEAQLERMLRESSAFAENRAMEGQKTEVNRPM